MWVPLYYGRFSTVSQLHGCFNQGCSGIARHDFKGLVRSRCRHSELVCSKFVLCDVRTLFHSFLTLTLTLTLTLPAIKAYSDVGSVLCDDSICALIESDGVALDVQTQPYNNVDLHGR